MLRIEVQIIEAQVNLIFAAFQEVDRFIDRDAVDPGKKARIALEIRQCFVRLDESFLREVIGVLVIGRHMVNRGVDAFLITLDKSIEGGVVPLLRSAH